MEPSLMNQQQSPKVNTIELSEPGYPMTTHMISNALFPDMQLESCPWVIDQSHPLVPEMKVVRMFVVEGGVHVYSAPSSGGICTRTFVSMGWIKLVEEVMPIDVFLEELAGTVKPGSPMISRMVSNSFSKKDEPIIWIVGQPHPYSLSGVNMKVLRILIDDDVAEVYSVSSDGKNGMRHLIPAAQVRFAEEAMTPDLFVKELEAAENGDDDDDDDDDEEELVEPGDPGEPEGPNEPEPNPEPAAATGSAMNGQPTAT
jgi:hypothetical protein